MNNERTNTPTLLLLFLIVVFGTVLLRSAWISEDAYITLRTVDNFVHGYGLTWNIAERVQAYTHPLWMLLLSGLYFFTREGFYTTLLLSFAASLGTLILATRAVKRHTAATYAGLSVLIFSKAFIEFSTSGLENPLTHLLLAAFLLLFLCSTEHLDDRRIFWLSFIAGLATLNRMDTLLFYVPALIYILWRRHDRLALRQIILGMLPFILWEIFSLVYYGVPFPNTAYAKLNTGLSRADLLEQGYLYFMNSLHWDPITLTFIALAFGVVALHGSRLEKIAALGVVFYLFYTFWIGADYMSGRFFSAALLGAVILLNRHLTELPVAESAVFLVFTILLGFISPTPTLTSIDDASFATARVDVNGVSDERSFYYQPSSLIYDQKNLQEPYHEWVYKGMEMKLTGKKVFVLYNIGFAGFYAGSGVYIIDRLALADPLLARLKPPIDQSRDRLTGHFERAIPEGYFESVRNNENRIADPNLKQYYEIIRLVTRGPLWRWERFVAIWKLNTGQYKPWVEAYNAQQNAP